MFFTGGLKGHKVKTELSRAHSAFHTNFEAKTRSAFCSYDRYCGAKPITQCKMCLMGECGSTINFWPSAACGLSAKGCFRSLSYPIILMRKKTPHLSFFRLFIDKPSTGLLDLDPYSENVVDCHRFTPK